MWEENVIVNLSPGHQFVQLLAVAIQQDNLAL